MEQEFAKILKKIGVDTNTPSMHKTAKRAADALKYLTKGYNENINNIVNDAIFPSSCKDMVIIKDIELYSLCEHHLLPFMGTCHVAYIPDQQVLGISKIARLVDVFARRLQIQENLTQEIATCILEVIKPKGVAVTIQAEHLCMRMRGVQKQHSTLITSAMLGIFREDAKTRAEYLALIGK
ncbi:MAG: GTP cyclohydrolase I FolE [Thiotrichales bacterium]|nr:MAG: GTP cyclohydrolase I FolE [Thiotrichales bacterium]